MSISTCFVGLFGTTRLKPIFNPLWPREITEQTVTDNIAIQTPERVTAVAIAHDPSVTPSPRRHQRITSLIESSRHTSHSDSHRRQFSTSSTLIGTDSDGDDSICYINKLFEPETTCPEQPIASSPLLSSESAIILHPLHHSNASKDPLTHFMLPFQRAHQLTNNPGQNTLYGIMQIVLKHIAKSYIIQTVEIQDEYARETGDGGHDIPQHHGDDHAENADHESESDREHSNNTSDASESEEKAKEEQIPLSLHEYILANKVEDHEEEVRVQKEAFEEKLEQAEKALDSANRRVAVIQRQLKSKVEKHENIITNLRSNLEKTASELQEQRDITLQQGVLISDLQESFNEAAAVARKQRALADTSDAQMIELRRRIRSVTDELFEKSELFQSDIDAANQLVSNAQTTSHTYRRQLEESMQTTRQAVGIIQENRHTIETQAGRIRALEAEIEAHKETENFLRESNEHLSRRAAANLILADAERATVEVLRRNIERLTSRVDELEEVNDDLRDEMDGSGLQNAKEEVEELEQALENRQGSVDRAVAENRQLEKTNAELREKISEVHSEKSALAMARLLDNSAKNSMAMRLEKASRDLDKAAAEKLQTDRKYAGLLRATANGAVSEDDLVKTIAAHLETVLDDNEQLSSSATEADRQRAEAQKELGLREVKIDHLQHQIATFETKLKELTEANSKNDIDLLNAEVEVEAKSREATKAQEKLEAAHEETSLLKTKLEDEHDELIGILVDRSNDRQVIQHAIDEANAAIAEANARFERLADAYREEREAHLWASADFSWINGTWTVLEESHKVHLQRMHQAERKYRQLKKRIESGPDELTDDGSEIWEDVDSEDGEGEGEGAQQGALIEL